MNPALEMFRCINSYHAIKCINLPNRAIPCGIFQFSMIHIVITDMRVILDHEIWTTKNVRLDVLMVRMKGVRDGSETTGGSSPW